MDAFFGGLIALGDPYLLALLFVATLGGVFIGALPGLNATTGAALLLPFTLTMEPVPAIAILTAIYCSATFAGAITAILINTPNNPTCAIYSRETLEAIADVCIRHDLWATSDEVYWSLANGKHISPMAIPRMRDRTLALLSMSKSHGLTGWRIGWIVSTEAMSYNFTQHNLVSNYGMCDFISKAAQEALNGDFGLQQIADTYRRRGTVFLDALGDTNDIRVLNEPGSMYFMLDIRAKAKDSKKFAFDFLKQELVAVMPGESFGPSAAGHLRISLGETEERIQQAATRLRSFASSYTE